MEKKEQEIDELKSKIASYGKQLDIAIKTGNVEDKILFGNLIKSRADNLDKLLAQQLPLNYFFFQIEFSLSRFKFLFW